jgi:DNA (cytosine-5)-methyltransferase 1
MIKVLHDANHSTNRIYSTDGIARALRATSGGLGAKTGVYAVNVQTSGRGEGTLEKRIKNQVGQVGRGDGGDSRNQKTVIAIPLKFHGRNQRNFPSDYAFTVDTVNTGGVNDGTRYRQLTPLECERLQGFPDNWTKNISNRQRYKTLGNAVTVPVVEAIARKLRNVQV